MHGAGTVDFEGVGFAYEGQTPLLEGFTGRFDRGWTGLVGANGAGKTTVLKLATGGLEPTAGRVRTLGVTIYCEQGTEEAPPGLAEWLAAADAEAARIRGILGVGEDWLDRWPTLSHGERKRAQVGVFLVRRPDVLALDEPTNHLDGEARRMLRRALESFRGVGLLVSHDRELLDGLCDRCLFLDPPRAVLRPGGYSKGAGEADRERESVRREREKAGRERRKLEREAGARRREAARSHSLRSKKGLPLRDHDGRAKKNLARLSGKDGRAGRQLRQLDGRLRRAREEEASLHVAKERASGIWMAGERSSRNALFRVEEGELPLGGGRRLHLPALALAPDGRVALTGPNGSGKSTLVRRILEGLDLPPHRLTYVPQEIDEAASRAILRRARGLPPSERGLAFAVVSRLGSDPERVLRTTVPSPGETRKLLLALGVARVPHLVVMDEPTNHMDLPSIECLEKALADCPCGLLLVSHDRPFLKAVTATSWEIRPESGAEGVFRLRENA